jgi:hypothetical protein
MRRLAWIGFRLVCGFLCIAFAGVVAFTGIRTVDFQVKQGGAVTAVAGCFFPPDSRPVVIEWWESRARLVRGAFVWVDRKSRGPGPTRVVISHAKFRPAPTTTDPLMNSIRMPFDDEEESDSRFEVPLLERTWTWWPRLDESLAPYARTLWVPLWMPAAVFGIVGSAPLVGRVRGAVRRWRGLCGNCGYERRGLADGAVCPECGVNQRALNKLLRCGLFIPEG